MTTTTFKNATETTFLPHALVEYLDGSKLHEHVGEAICVTTVDEDGWPHASLLSVGELLASDTLHLRLAVWAKSTTAKNLARDGRLSLTMVHDGALWEVQLIVQPLGGGELARFAGTVSKVRAHRVDYADVLGCVTYRLHDQPGVIQRWEHQIHDLRAA